MTQTLTLSVPETAALMARSERTVWRQIRSGELQTRRVGRRVLVVLESDAPSASDDIRGHVGVGEVAVGYGTPVPLMAETWQVGPWPYTPTLIERHRAARLARRKAAVERMVTFRANGRPDRDGLTYQDYRNADDEFPRALDGGHAADLALEEQARARRADR
ncbi:MAG: hypothetical protein ABIP77_00150 [Candidatus Limnocylindrales bacterium]